MPNLVGIGNSQVPTNAMLGGLAYQDSVGEINIDKIKARISDTAADVFVYDTRKDSDGGAWRKKATTQSWYDEGASETRGARKEFPTVAVIVVEDGATYQPVITIYDGDDPNLPMWMVFKTRNAAGGNDQRSSVSYYAAGPYPIRKVAMLNGVMVDCQYRSAGHAAGTVKGVTRYNFINDSSTMMTDEGDFKRNGNLGDERNTERSYTKISTTDINHTQCNDVAVTVLPNAPIDASTGLPIITIAVATDGGVNVLKDNGTVVNWTETSGPNSAQLVTFRKDSKLGVFTSGTAGIAGYPQLYYIEISSSDSSANYWYNFNSLGIEKYGYNLETNSAVRLIMNTAAAGALSGVVDTDDNTYASTNDGGLGVILPPESVGTTANMTTAAISYVTKDYNTGYMSGDIRGALLSDTDDTDVTGTYLYLDNFSNNDKGWSFADNGSDGVSGGVMTIANNASARATDYDALNGVATGTKLLVQFTVTFGAAGTLTLDDDGAGAGLGGNTNLLQATKSGSGTQTVSSIYTKTASNRVRFIRTSGGNFQIDNFEMKILPEDDRSVKNNGLAVYGTITKSPVAAGAELVAYSGFSNSNYLFQPYDSDLDFTTTMSIMFWVKDWVGSDSLLHRGPGTTRNSKTSFHVYCSYDYNYRITFTTNGSSEQSFEFNHTANLPGWQCVCFTLSGGTVRGFRNGVEQTMSSTSFSGNIFSQATDKNGLWIGTGPVGGAADTASLALLRLSASVPSAEQVKKIYNDEKCLFHENAKCTLYGTSNDINALAVDDSNNVVHAGTSSGRSDFRGLNRINNTTTAVTTTISASNEFIAEQ